MSNKILFIFEGNKTEQNITRNLKQFYIEDKQNQLLQASYGHNIYNLCNKLKQDDGLDLFELIKEEVEKRTNKSDTDHQFLAIESTESISDIYLFFDYDPHCSNANDQQLEEALTLFDDSMENGLLLISYPMVEAIRHQGNFDEPLTYSTQHLSEYKTFVNTDENVDSTFHNWGLYTKDTWEKLIEVHLKRVNTLIEGHFAFPSEPIEQQIIFTQQKEKYIPQEQCLVLSAFPLMLHDFYGKRLLENLN